MKCKDGNKYMIMNYKKGMIFNNMEKQDPNEVTYSFASALSAPD